MCLMVNENFLVNLFFVEVEHTVIASQARQCHQGCQWLIGRDLQSSKQDSHQ